MANRIEILRNAAGLKRTEVATALDVSETTVYRWEKGSHGITDEKKLELARVLHTSVAFMMGWDQPIPDGHGNGERHAEVA